MTNKRWVNNTSILSVDGAEAIPITDISSNDKKISPNQIGDFIDNYLDIPELKDVVSMSTVGVSNSTKYRIVSGVIRQDTSSGGWYIISDNHNSIGLDSVSSDSNGDIKLDYNFTASKIVNLMITPDEVYQQLGIWAGVSVGTSSAIIKLSKDLDIKVNLSSVVTTNSTVNSDSNSAQKILYVASTTGFNTGNKIIIGHGTAREEFGVIDSISAETSLTLEDNLTYTHTLAQADAVRKYATTGISTSAYFSNEVFAFSNGDGSVTIIHPPVPSSSNNRYSSTTNGTSTYTHSINHRIIQLSTTQFKIAPYISFNGYINYNGSSWVVSTSCKTDPILNWDTDRLKVTHEQLSGSTIYSTILTARYGGYIPQINVISNTQFNVYFYDYSGTKITTPDTNMKFFYSNSCMVLCETQQGYVNILTQGAKLNSNYVYNASGNFWINGLMEV